MNDNVYPNNSSHKLIHTYSYILGEVNCSLLYKTKSIRKVLFMTLDKQQLNSSQTNVNNGKVNADNCYIMSNSAKRTGKDQVI